VTEIQVARGFKCFGATLETSGSVPVNVTYFVDPGCATTSDYVGVNQSFSFIANLGATGNMMALLDGKNTYRCIQFSSGDVLTVSGLNFGPSACAAPADGAGAGDPVFVDFNHTRFSFNGHANGVYHIFSDPFMSVNALFAYANPTLRSGTVMSLIAVQVGKAQIVFSIEKSKKIGVSMNNKTLVAGDVETVGCVTVTVPKSGNCEISTPHHHFTVNTRTESNAHINTTYLNFNLKISGETVSSIGGVTRVSNHRKDSETLFVASGLFATDAPSSTFLHTPLKCRAGALDVKGKNIKVARSQ